MMVPQAYPAHPYPRPILPWTAAATQYFKSFEAMETRSREIPLHESANPLRITGQLVKNRIHFHAHVSL